MRLCSQKGDRSRLWISCLRRRWSEPGASPAGTPPRACATGQPEAKHSSPPPPGPQLMRTAQCQGQWSESPPAGWDPAKLWLLGPSGPGPPTFPGSPCAGLGAGAGWEQWPWPPASPSMPGLVLFPFGKGLLLHRHHWETLPQQHPAPLPAGRGGGCRKDKPPGAKGRGGDETSPWGAAPCTKTQGGMHQPRG